MVLLKERKRSEKKRNKLNKRISKQSEKTDRNWIWRDCVCTALQHCALIRNTKKSKSVSINYTYVHKCNFYGCCRRRCRRYCSFFLHLYFCFLCRSIWFRYLREKNILRSLEWPMPLIVNFFCAEKAWKQFCTHITFNYSFEASLQTHFMNCPLHYLCGLR